MNGISKLFNSSIGGLIFSLLCGSAYFVIVLSFILKNTETGGGLLAFFIAPAVICGIALLIIKSAKKLIAEEEFAKLNLMMYSHIVLMILSAVFLIEIIK